VTLHLIRRKRFILNEAMARAYITGVYTMAEIGEHFGVHYMTVSRAVKMFEGGNGSMYEC
jgi:transposase